MSLSFINLCKQFMYILFLSLFNDECIVVAVVGLSTVKLEPLVTSMFSTCTFRLHESTLGIIKRESVQCRYKGSMFG